MSGIRIRWLGGARVAFGLVILFLSLATLVRLVLGAEQHFHPQWLLPALAGVEALAAIAFAFRATALSVAGLCATFLAAAGLHISQGVWPWHLAAFLGIAVLVYLLQRNRSDENHPEETQGA